MKVFEEKKSEVVASSQDIRDFVKSMIDLGNKLKEAKEDFKAAITENAEIVDIDEQLKDLKEKRKTVIEESAVLQSYVEKIDELLDEKDVLLQEADLKNVPKKEIEIATRMLKKNVDPDVTTDCFTQIADLIE